MKILLQSCLFRPSVGGTETSTLLLVQGLLKLGHDVKVITNTLEDSPDTAGIDIYRGASSSKFLELMKWCEIYVQSNISLRNLWPLLVYRRPWVVVHHTRIETDNPDHRFNNRLKQWAARFAVNFAVSRSMAESLQAPSIVVKNPYADNIFRRKKAKRDRELIVVGRFNEDKGFQIAIEALDLLLKRGHPSIKMTIVGEGYYRDSLVALVKEKNLQRHVEFTGMKSQQDLADLLNRHKILIVPSIAEETFGLIAVEGIACGCFLIASDVGSLKDTIGPCGLTFPVGNAEKLSKMIENSIDHPETMTSYLRSAPSYLPQFSRAAIIPFYADQIRHVLAHGKF